MRSRGIVLAWSALLLAGAALVAVLTVLEVLVVGTAVLGGIVALAALVLVYRAVHAPVTDPIVHATGAEQLVLWNLRLFVPLAALSYQTQSWSIVLLVVLSGGTAVSMRSRRQPRIAHPLAVFLLITIGVLIEGRVVFALLTTVALLCLVVSTAKLRPETFPLAFYAVLESVAIYLFIGIVGYFVLGLRAPADLNHAGVLRSTFQVFDTRIAFPFTAALTTAPAMAAAYLVGYIGSFRFSWQPAGIFRLASAPAAVFVMLASEGRFAMVATIVLGVALYLRPRAISRHGWAIALAMLFLPLWWPLFSFVATPLLQAVAEHAPYLTRDTSAQSLISIQGRTVIWSATVDQLDAFDIGHLAFGFGPSGQQRWNATGPYTFIMGAVVTDPETATAHNSLLQQFVDAGIAGAAALLVVVVSVCRSLTRIQLLYPSRATIAAVALVVSLCFTASTEATLTSTLSQETYWLFVVIVTVVGGYEAALATESAQQPIPRIVRARTA